MNERRDHGDHHDSHEHHGDHHGGDHHGGDHGHGHGGDHHGPADTEFLNLEMSKVICADAQHLARDAARDILREAIRERLKERLGDRLRAVAHVVADALADDVEANLAIESKIGEHRASRKDLEAKVQAALAKAPERKTKGRRGE